MAQSGANRLFSKNKSGRKIASAFVYDKKERQYHALPLCRPENTLLIESISFVGLLTRMFRHFCQRARFAFPAGPFPTSDLLSQKKLRSILTARIESINCPPVVFRILTWFPCSANKNTCPTRKRGRVFATKAGAIFNCCREHFPHNIYDTVSFANVNGWFPIHGKIQKSLESKISGVVLELLGGFKLPASSFNSSQLIFSCALLMI